jgi:uncharacterized protein
MKTSLILLISFFAVTTICQASALPDFPFIFAQGKAETEIPPDLTKISFRIETFDQESENAVKIIDNRSLDLVAFFNEQKIDKEDITAYAVSKNSVRERKDYLELKILGYNVSRRFEITIHKMDQYEPFVKKLISFNNVVDIRSEFDRSDRKKIESDLIEKASDDANQ